MRTRRGNERCSSTRSCGARAFTLVELLVALGILGALIAVAVPAYRTWIAEIQQRNAAHGLLNALQLARSEAIKRGVRVNLCKSTDGASCTTNGGWEAGWVAFADFDASGEVDGAESVIVVEAPLAGAVTIRGNQPVDDYVSYTNLGTARLLNGALQMGTFQVCRSGLTALEVVLANSGRPRLQKTAVPCP